MATKVRGTIETRPVHGSFPECRETVNHGPDQFEREPLAKAFGENRKNPGKKPNVWPFGLLLNHFYDKIMEKLCLKAPQYHSAPIWTYNFSICECENPQTPHFHDFGIFERVPEPQNQYYLSLETPGHSKQSQKIPNHLKTYYIGKIEIWKFWKVWKRVSHTSW